MIQEVAAEALWRLSRVSGPVIGANGDRVASDYNSPPKLCRSLVNAIHIMDRKTSLALLFVSAIWKFPCFHRSASYPLKAECGTRCRITPSSGAAKHPSSPRHFFSRAASASERRREQRISRRGRTASLLLHPQPQLQGVLADLAEHLENFIQQRLLIIGDAPIGHDGP